LIAITFLILIAFGKMNRARSFIQRINHKIELVLEIGLKLFNAILELKVILMGSLDTFKVHF